MYTVMQSLVMQWLGMSYNAIPFVHAATILWDS